MHYRDEPAWVLPFLTALSQAGGAATCARAAGTTLQTVQRYAEENPSFAEAMREAEEVLADSLEIEAIRRGRDGFDEPVFNKGALVGYARRYSDALLTTMLKGRRGAVFGDKREINHKGNVQVLLAPIAQLPSNLPVIDAQPILVLDSDKLLDELL